MRKGHHCLNKGTYGLLQCNIPFEEIRPGSIDLSLLFHIEIGRLLELTI